MAVHCLESGCIVKKKAKEVKRSEALRRFACGDIFILFELHIKLIHIPSFFCYGSVKYHQMTEHQLQ